MYLWHFEMASHRYKQDVNLFLRNITLIYNTIMLKLSYTLLGYYYFVRLILNPTLFLCFQTLRHF